MDNSIFRLICKEYIRLAKKDLKKIKNKKRWALNDAYELGKMEREIESWELWADENLLMNNTRKISETDLDRLELQTSQTLLNLENKK